MKHLESALKVMVEDFWWQQLNACPDRKPRPTAGCPGQALAVFGLKKALTLVIKAQDAIKRGANFSYLTGQIPTASSGQYSPCLSQRERFNGTEMGKRR